MFVINPGLAEYCDRTQLTELFSACFPGEEKFAGWYFDNIWQPHKTLVMRIQDQILSMLHMLPVTFKDGENTVNGCYIFAVGTFPEIRGNGLAGMLLYECFNYCEKSGLSFAALIVGEPSLLNYYANYGMTPCFRMSKETVMPEEGDFELLNADDDEEINSLYQKALKNMPFEERNAQRRQEIMLVYKAYGLRKNGKLLSYCFAHKREDELYVYEAFGDYKDKLCAAVAFFEKCKKATVNTVSNQGHPIGSVVTFDEKGAELFKDEKNAYLNLYFN